MHRGLSRCGHGPVTSSLPVVFSEYGIAQPQSMVVLSVEDRGTMAFQVHLSRA